MLAAALQAEVNTYLAHLADRWDESGRRLVVRNAPHLITLVRARARFGRGILLEREAAAA